MRATESSPTTTQLRADKVGTYLWLLFGICFLSNVLGGQVSTIMPVYLPVVVASLLGNGNLENAEFSNISAYINALYIFGWAIGGLTWGIISDKVGRVKSLAFALGSYGLFTLLISFTPSWELVVIFRLLAGFGVGGVLVISVTYVSEVWPRQTRSIMIGILSIAFPIGIFSAGLVNFLVSDWRQGFMIGLAPMCLSVVTVWALKESEGWKAYRKQSKDTLVQLTQTYTRDLLRGAVIFGSMLIGLWAIFSWLPTWVQSLLNDSDGQTERSLSMMLLGAGGLAGGFFSGWISNALGVRKAMLICFSGCIILSVLLFKLNTTFTFLIYIEIACLAVFFGISQGLLSIYIPQLFPTPFRATATGFCFNVGRLVTVAAVFFLGALVSILGGYSQAMLSFSGIFILGLIALYFTKDKVNSLTHTD